MKVVFVMMALGWGLAACGDPCQDLANKVCNCYSTDAARRACSAKVSSLAGQRQSASTPKERDVCAALIPDCTCDALAAGNLKACGLSTE